MDKIEKIKEWVKEQKKEEFARNSNGRADLILSNVESKNYLDVEWTEKFAKEYYEFITERI